MFMNDVRLVFTTSSHWIGRLIRWFTKSKTSHIYIEYSSGVWGGRWAAEAKQSVRKILASKARKGVVAEYRFREDITDALRAGSGAFGQKYDYAGIIVFAWAIIQWQVFRKKFRKPLNATKGMFCSELVANILQHANYPEPLDWDPELVSPEDLLQYCERHPELFEKL